MDHSTLLEFLALTEKLKCTTRHSWTSNGRQESMADHMYRLCVFAWLVKDQFPEYDMDKVLKMCLFYDIKEAGEKDQILLMLPNKYQEELSALINELTENQTMEAKIVHALDKMETVIQHNESSLDTWLPSEYEQQMVYGEEEANAHIYLKHLRKVIKEDTARKIESAVDDALELQISEMSNDEHGYHILKGSEYMDKDRVAELLHATFWAKDRSKETIEKCIDQSISYGVFDKEERQVGYARIISDMVTTFYLMDVVIDEEYRGQGLGKMLLNVIMEDVGHLYGILHTEDAQGLYEKYGFRVTDSKTDQIMEKPRA